MSAPKRPIDHLLDACLFVPAGFLANARDLVPELAAKGREQVDLQVRIARMLGKFVVSMGQQEAGKALRRLSPASPERRPAAVATSAPSAREVPVVVPSLADEEVIPVRIDDADAVTAASVGEDELAIPGYDSLAASQVVPRLDGLTPDELEAVRRYELAHRGRKTVLGKVAQLQER